MKKITFSAVKKLNPCSERLENALKHYNGKSFTIKEFLSLERLYHDDKVWVAVRMMPNKNIRFVACETAKSVLNLYEAEYPDDDRPRKPVKEALKKKVNSLLRRLRRRPRLLRSKL